MRILAIAATLCLVVAGCSGGGDGAGPTDDPDAAVATIRGLVVDQSIAPIAGVTVTLTGGPDAGRTAETGADGQFNFTRVQPGDHFLSVGKAGYKGAQVSVTAIAGNDDPELVRILLERIAVATPYVDHFKLEGYYDCAFSYGEPGNPFITDSCDFAYRTAWDEANSTGNPPPAPRTVQTAINTQYIDIPQDTFSVVQEAFWDDESVPVMMILLSSTPINNACDCSETDYLDVTQPNPTLSRRDRYDANGTEDEGFPVGQHVAARGFLSWESTAVAQDLQFVVITSLFHNYVPDPEWTFETRDNFPVG